MKVFIALRLQRVIKKLSKNEKMLLINPLKSFPNSQKSGL